MHVGTFHALCVQLLRRAPAGVGVDPGFELLDDMDARWLVEDLAERLVLAGLEREDPLLVELCRELQFRGLGNAAGLVDLLCQVYAKTREEGLDPELVPVTDEKTARAEFDDGLKRFRQVLGEASAADVASERKFSGVLSGCARAVEGMSFDNFLEDSHYPALASVVLGDKNLTRQRKEPLASALKELSHMVKPGSGEVGLREWHAAARVAPHEKTFRALLGRLRTVHREELRKRSALDFSELLIQTRDLLRDYPAVREEVQRRTGALLVDEFQDTNRLQLELVVMLAEKRHGAPRTFSPADELVKQLPLEPASLCAVGDRKQSIYEFRGADVSVFGVLASKIEEEGGHRHFLQRNYRSSPSLVGFFNGVFAEVMAPTTDARPYEVAYEPEGDDLVAHKPGESLSKSVERLIIEPGEDAAQCRELDAQFVARRIAQLLGPDAPALVREKDGTIRRPRGGDIAILFRRFVHLETYRQALTRQGIPHRVVRGRGFYGAQEVLDLASFLSLLSDPNDGISLAAVLRSPLVGVQDATLLRLADFGRTRLSVGSAEKFVAAPAFPQTEAQRVKTFLTLFRSLRAQSDRLGVREILKVLLAETEYPVLLAGTPFGEQALANVDKLMELAGRWDQQGKGDGAAFAKLLLDLAAREPNEAQADVLDLQDGRAVQLLTIHAAKGLEFPVVFVPDLAAPPQNSGSRIPFDRALGLCIKPWIPDHPEPLRSTRSVQIGNEVMRRERAQYKRLLYVALTRAKDRLILSGPSARKMSTWKTYLDDAIAARPELSVRVLDLNEDQLSPVSSKPQVEAQPADPSRLNAAIERASAKPNVMPAAAVFPVTHLQDFFLCPRRYLYARQVRLSEFPIAFELEPGGEQTEGKRLADPRLRGTLAHKLLETLDFRWALEDPKRQNAALKELLWAQGVAPDDEGATDLLEWVRRFLGTKFAASLAHLPPERVHRELPFLLRLEGPEGGPALHLKGQIDLLVEEVPGRVCVIDYKAAKRHPQGLEPYAFQLECYALAARHFASSGTVIETGISFLQEKNPEPERVVVQEDAIAALRRKLSGQEVTGPHSVPRSARAPVEGPGLLSLLMSSRQEEWPGRPASECARIHCGYQYRCHAATPAL